MERSTKETWQRKIEKLIKALGLVVLALMVAQLNAEAGTRTHTHTEEIQTDAKRPVNDTEVPGC